jgi:hypothetical protein
MAFTVVPLHNLELPAGSRVPFGKTFVLEDNPEWLRADKGILECLCSHDRQSTRKAKHALVAEYEAASIGESDPEWKGKEPRSIQQLKFQSAILANLALWLRQPSPVCFTVVFHALSWSTPGESERVPIIQQSERYPPLYCHPKDSSNPVSVGHVVKAGELYAVLTTIPRNNPVWEALRAFWAALTMYSADYRYPFFWLGLESLFGAEDATEIGYKLCQRIAFFLADSSHTARDLFKKAKNCYRTRSKIIHGRWEHDPKIDAVMADTEEIVRTVVRRLLENRQMLDAFISKRRDAFLDDWVFSRSTDPPPFCRLTR